MLVEVQKIRLFLCDVFGTEKFNIVVVMFHVTCCDQRRNIVLSSPRRILCLVCHKIHKLSVEQLRRLSNLMIWWKGHVADVPTQKFEA
jgi:hypothetical protein